MREARVILVRVERQLRSCGAETTRDGHGALRFRMPAPWRARRLGALAPISSGSVDLVAGGGPWRVRYRIKFTLLRSVALLLSAALLALGWTVPRLTLWTGLAVLWALGFGVPWLVASRQFYRLVWTAARDVIERRQASRPTPGTGQATDAPPT